MKDWKVKGCAVGKEVENQLGFRGSERRKSIIIV
jgi:hypothetical protein